jgi:hypothetical protein
MTSWCDVTATDGYKGYPYALFYNSAHPPFHLLGASEYKAVFVYHNDPGISGLYCEKETVQKTGSGQVFVLMGERTPCPHPGHLVAVCSSSASCDVPPYVDFVILAKGELAYNGGLVGERFVPLPGKDSADEYLCLEEVGTKVVSDAKDVIDWSHYDEMAC